MSNNIVFDGYYLSHDDVFYYILYDKKTHTTKLKTIKNPRLKVSLVKSTPKIRYFIKKADIKDKNLIKEVDIRYLHYTKIKPIMLEIYDRLGDIELADISNISIQSFDNIVLSSIINIEAINDIIKYIKNDNDRNIINSILNLKYEIYNDIKYYTYYIKTNKIDISEISDYQSYVIFDIEVLSSGDFPDIDNPVDKIISISYYINKPNKKEYILRYIPSDKNVDTKKIEEELLNKIKCLKNINLVDDIKIISHDNEMKMLLLFFNDIKDVLTLHAINGNNFDIPYLFNRFKYLLSKYKEKNIDVYEKILVAIKNTLKKIFITIYDEETGDIKIHNNSDVIRLGSIVYIDFLNMIEFQLGSNFLEKQSLEYIASKVLDNSYLTDGEDTFKVNISDISYTYLNNLVDFLFYSFKDTYLLVEIERKLQTINFIYILKSIIPFELSNLSISNIISSYFYNVFSDEYLILNSFKKNFYSKKIFKIYSKVNADFGYILKHVIDNNKNIYSISINYNKDDLNIENEENESSLNDIRYYSFIKSPTNYIGAFVKNPIASIYDNVIDFDASSLYPTLIYNFNISHDTLIYLIPEKLSLFFLYEDENKINELIEKYKSTKITIYDNIRDIFLDVEVDKLFKYIKTKKYILTPLGSVRYNPILEPDKVGFIRKSEELPIKYRKTYKKKMNEYQKDSIEYIKYDGIQQVYKKIANSIYGVGGDKTSRFFNLIYATDITASGRSLILYTSYNVNQLLNKLLLKNT